MNFQSLLFGTAFFLMSACGGKEPAPGNAGNGDSGPNVDTADSAGTHDSGTHTDTAIDTGTPNPVTFSSVSTSLSDNIPTVIIVTFSTETTSNTDTAQPAEAWVRFGAGSKPDSNESGMVAAAEEQDDGSFRAVLVGIPPLTEAWMVPGMGTTETDTYTITTGEGPSGFPEVATDDGAPTDGFLVAGTLYQGVWGTYIMTTEGQPVWWYEWEDRSDLLSLSVKLAPDKQSMWFVAFQLLAAGVDGEGAPSLVNVSMEGELIERIELDEVHHDFLLLDDGTVTWIEYDERVFDGDLVRGDRLMERAPDGTITELWSTWDTFTYIHGETVMSPDTWWTMGNQLAYDAENDAYVISLRVIHTVVSWSREAKEVNWILGSDSPSLASDTQFSGQHGLQVLDGGNLLVFDNGTNESASRVLEFEIDETDETAEVVWQYDPETTLYSYVLGDAIRLDNGNTIAIFGTEKTIQEVTQDKQVVWEMSFADSTLIGFAQYHEQVVNEPTP